MSIIFGTVLLTFAAGTTAWATIGDRIAAMPGVARVLAYIDGGYNIPSDDKVDELVDYAKRRKAAGVADRDDIMPGTRVTYLEHFESTCMRDAVSEAEVHELGRDDEFSLLTRDEALLALVFAQIVVEGKVQHELRRRALLCLKRQQLPALLHGWGDRRLERALRLERMREILARPWD